MANLRTVFVLNVIASVFGYTAIGLGISSLASTVWIDGPRRQYGLFRYCLKGFGCSGLTGDSRLLAVRAFMTITVILDGFGAIANIISQSKKDKKTRMGSAFLWLLAGICGIVACSVFTYYNNDFVLDKVAEYGYGYIFAWITTWLLVLAGAAQLASASQAEDLMGYEIH